MSSSCEKGTKLHGYNTEKSKKYCKQHNIQENSIVKPYYNKTVSGRFYGEKWRNICDEKECDIDTIRNPLDSREKGCYPTVRLDNDTGVLASELNNNQMKRICSENFFNEIPKEIVLNIRLGKLLLEEGVPRYYKSEIEDFTIAKEISPEMLYLWKCWIDLHGPDYSKVCIDPETSNSKNQVIYPNTNIRPINYYLKYKKWISQSDRRGSIIPKGAIEWLLKGSNEAYLWLKTKWVKETILSKYPWVCFDTKNRL